MAKAESSVANVNAAGGSLGKVSEWPARLREYYGELKSEMQRVTWPTWQQVRSTTVVVILAVFAFAAYFAAVDMVWGRAVQRVFTALTK